MNKTTEQRIADAAWTHVQNRYKVLADDVCLELALAQVTRYVEDQDESISPEKIVATARKACDLIRDKFRAYAAL